MGPPLGCLSPDCWGGWVPSLPWYLGSGLQTPPSCLPCPYLHFPPVSAWVPHLSLTPFLLSWAFSPPTLPYPLLPLASVFSLCLLPPSLSLSLSSNLSSSLPAPRPPILSLLPTHCHCLSISGQKLEGTLEKPYFL